MTFGPAHIQFSYLPPPPQGLMLYLILDEVPMFPNNQTRDAPPTRVRFLFSFRHKGNDSDHNNDVPVIDSQLLQFL